MATYTTYTMTIEDRENDADFAKTRILQCLVDEGAVTQEIAEEWCKTHTVVLRKKSFFQTISNLWKNEKESKGNYFLVVKLTQGV